jgi:hypothetical protein
MTTDKQAMVITAIQTRHKKISSRGLESLLFESVDPFHLSLTSFFERLLFRAFH